MFRKLSNFFRSKKKSIAKKIVTIAATLCMVFCMSAICLATEGTTADYSTLITQLNDGLGANAFIGVVGDVLPYIITVTIVSLVWYLVKRAIKKFSKGKPGV